MSKNLHDINDCTAADVQEACITHWQQYLGSTEEPYQISKLYKGALPDSATVFTIGNSASGPLAVLLCSPPAAPDIVSRSMQRTTDAYRLLGPRIGQRVLQPLASGDIRGLSCALMPFCIPIANKRPLVWLDNRRLQPIIFAWLAESLQVSASVVASKTIASEFELPIELFSRNVHISKRTANRALDALKKLRTGQWVPRTSLMHGDLWRGNVMLRGRKGASLKAWADRVVIIDWAGSRLNGYPMFDLVRFSASTRTSTKNLAKQVSDHCELLQCEKKYASFYLIAALAYILQTLEHFPISKFSAMCESTLDLLDLAVDG